MENSIQYFSEQESFWAGHGGDEYIERCGNDGFLSSRLAIFTRMLSKTSNIESVLELGANVGQSLEAINILLPKSRIDAIEINKNAFEALKRLPFINRAYHASILDFDSKQQYDFVFTLALLILILPDHLERAYNLIYRLSKRYIGIIEYYNPTPVEVEYRGERGKLFKRDFAGDLLDAYSNLELVDYGFLYHRQPNFVVGDLHWFLLRKI